MKKVLVLGIVSAFAVGAVASANTSANAPVVHKAKKEKKMRKHNKGKAAKDAAPADQHGAEGAPADAGAGTHN